MMAASEAPPTHRRNADEGPLHAAVDVGMALTGKTFVVGIGAQKAGTTWLYDYLSRHPQVAMSPIKELHYWDWRYRPDLCSGVDGHFRERLARLSGDAKAAAPLQGLKGRLRHVRDGLAGFMSNGPTVRDLRDIEDRVKMADDESAYISFFETRVPATARVFGEITPSYSMLPTEGFRRIREQHQPIGVLFLLRDPVDRFWTGFCHSCRKNRLSPLEVFELAFSNPWDLERTRYDLTLERLDEVFPENEVLVEFYETLFSESAIRRLASFLHIEPRQAMFETRVNFHPKPSLTPRHADVVRELLAPVYDYCRRRFGDRVPKSWR